MDEALARTIVEGDRIGVARVEAEEQILDLMVAKEGLQMDFDQCTINVII